MKPSLLREFDRGASLAWRLSLSLSFSFPGEHKPDRCSNRGKDEEIDAQETDVASEKDWYTDQTIFHG